MKLNLSALARYSAPVRLLAFVGLLLVGWLPFVVLAEWLIDDSNLVSILVMVLLFVEFLGLVRIWGWHVHQSSHPLRSYGLGGSRRNGLELLQWLSLGLISLLGLFALEGIWGWLSWQASPHLVQTALEGLGVALGVAFGEELVFRGWLLDELQRDYTPVRSLWISSLVFAILHFIRPLPEILATSPQFLGLVLLGLILVWAKRSHQGRLGAPIGLHAGLVWGYYIIDVGDLVEYSNRVPEWVTGVNQNPLAGVAGLLFLGAIAYAIRGWLYQRIDQKQTEQKW